MGDCSLAGDYCSLVKNLNVFFERSFVPILVTVKELLFRFSERWLALTYACLFLIFLSHLLHSRLVQSGF